MNLMTDLGNQQLQSRFDQFECARIVSPIFPAARIREHEGLCETYKFNVIGSGHSMTAPGYMLADVTLAEAYE